MLINKYMKNKFILAGVIASLGITSCGSYSKMTTRNNKVDHVRTISPITYPVLMDLAIDLSVKVKGNSSGIITYVLTEEYYKDLALSQAIINAKCDILIEPTYLITKSVTKKGNRSIVNIEVEVSGYPAVYKNPRNINPSDTSMIKFMSGTSPSGSTVKVTDPSTETKQDKKNENKRIF